MTPDERPRLGYRGDGLATRMRGFFFKALILAASIVLLIGAIAVSIVMFAIALTAILVVFAFVWWKTRELRKRMRAHRTGSDIIEGEVIHPQRDVSEHSRDERR